MTPYSHLPTSANLDMLNPRSRFVFLATAIATLLAASFNSNFAGDEPFHDPLTGKTASAKRGDKPSKPALLKVSLTADKANPTQMAGEIFVLSISLKLPSGGHTYSTNPGFTGATKIKLTQTEGLEPVEDKFLSDHDPKIEIQDGESVEKFKDAVTWTRRFRLKPDAKRSDVRILSQVRYQICDALNCTPYDETFFASADAPAEVIVTEAAKVAAFKSRFAPPATPPAPTITPKLNSAFTRMVEAKTFEVDVIPQRVKAPDPIKVRFRLSPDNAQPGESVLLSVTMELEPRWHTFALDQDEKKSPGLPTLITIDKAFGLKATEDKFSPSLMPDIERTDEGQEQRVHHKQITWTMPFVVETAKYGVSGLLGYQICRPGTCLLFKKVPFALGHVVVAPPSPIPVDGGTKVPATVTKVETEPGINEPDEDPDTTARPLNELLPSFQKETFFVEDDSEGGLGKFLIYAFLGGLILNVMPCVLPVIAFKIFGFLKQAGESRSRILLLNVMYSVGVVFVFVILASLAVFAKFGWGGLFQETGFQVGMACVVFAMGLSLLGVFEIPLPGLVGSAAASHQQQEGLLGAFLTGIFATLLATPCSGPFLGVTLGWSVKQEPLITYLVWSVMGLGMASPYLVLGFFPGWVKYLPKPGNWMVTFKEVCGLLLLATVIFLMSSLKQNWVFPMLILLLSLGCALWMIGRLYTINSTGQRRWTVRSLASVVCLGGWWLSLALADELPKGPQLPWKPFSTNVVDAELKQGRTVLIDFTASWCVTCQTNKRIALNREETLQFVKQHDVLTLKADWSNGSPEVTRWLNSFDSKSIPFLIIFPGKDPTHPIVIRDAYTKTTLLKKLQEAVTAGQTAEQAVSQR